MLPAAPFQVCSCICVCVYKCVCVFQWGGCLCEGSWLCDGLCLLSNTLLITKTVGIRSKVTQLLFMCLNTPDIPAILLKTAQSNERHLLPQPRIQLYTFLTCESNLGGRLAGQSLNRHSELCQIRVGFCQLISAQNLTNVVFSLQWRTCWLLLPAFYHHPFLKQR